MSLYEAGDEKLKRVDERQRLVRTKEKRLVARSRQLSITIIIYNNDKTNLLKQAAKEAFTNKDEHHDGQ